MMDAMGYFHVLGVGPEATTGEIKKAYRRLVFKYHPDYDGRPAARKNYIKITEAYRILIDPVKRDAYVRGQGNAVTDKPWTILENYWEVIYQRGFQKA